MPSGRYKIVTCPYCGQKFAELTDREYQILRASILFGYKGAAQRLGITRNTVKNELVVVRKKLNVTTSREAYQVIMERGAYGRSDANQLYLAKPEEPESAEEHASHR